MSKLRLAFLAAVTGLMIFNLPFASADAPVEGRRGRDEIRYMTQMIDHHGMAIMMAMDCLMRASAEEVMTLCQNIIDAQSAEISELQNWLSTWYGVRYNPMPMTDMMNMSTSTMEATPAPDATQEADMGPMDMPMSGMMVVLDGLEGQAYEVVFMETMIDHHNQAVDMSERLLEQTANEGHQELRDFAQRVIDDQTAEIQEMESMIAARA